mgnify:FL=1
MLMKIYAETYAFAPDQGLFPKVHIKKKLKTHKKKKNFPYFATLICRPMLNPVDLSQKRYEDHGFVRG